MPSIDVESFYVSEQDSRLFASRQILPFLFVPKEHDEHGRLRARRRAPSKSLLSFAAIPPSELTDSPEGFRWKTRLIYDVDGLLLFRDQTLSLGPGQELRVRTAANALLKSPVWSVGAGKEVDIHGLINKVLSWIKEKHPELEPVIGHEKIPRLICYAYPKLGILCQRKDRPSVRFVVDLWELVVIPVDPDYKNEPLEYVRTIWSPFDNVTRGSRASLLKRWDHNVATLPRLSVRDLRAANENAEQGYDDDVATLLRLSLDDLRWAIENAGRRIKESRITCPELELEYQQTPYFCAAATAKMILDFYGIRRVPNDMELSQAEIYNVLGTSDTGSRPEDQVNAIPVLTHNTLMAKLDVDPLFEEAEREIRAERPFKTGTAGHARACGGFLIEGDPMVNDNDKEWLYIYDPYPANIGEIYYEAWEIGYYLNYMIVLRGEHE